MINKIFKLVFLFITCVACSGNSNHQKTSQHDMYQQHQQINNDFQQIIDSAYVAGSILIYDPQDSTWTSNDFEWARTGRLPASTFKIANSIIALESGVVNNESTIFYWNGEKRRLPQWEHDMTFTEAFHLSCVPCYQDIARQIGADRMNSWLAKLRYGDMQVDSLNINKFWLEGDSKISQFQQIDFLNRFWYSKLPIAKRTENIVKRMMIIDKTESYTLSGKTGWAIRNGNNNGWFVGYIEKGERVYFFAINISPHKQFNMDLFPLIRKDITIKALIQMNIIPS